MKWYRILALGTVFVLVVALFPAAGAQAAPTGAGPISRPLINRGVTTLAGASSLGSGPNSLELPPALGEGSPVVNRSLSHGHGARPSRNLPVPKVAASPVVSAGSELGVSFLGLNHRDSRLAFGGNQFSLEPPDQGLCVGNGYVLETVNDALRVFDTAGNPLTVPIALNQFYNYPPAINRTTGVYGPELTDPSCYFDPGYQRWFHIVLTLDLNPNTGDLTGVNSLDMAVSQTANPTGAWNIYSFPVTDDGTQGTPVHANCPCVGDYPHIGADQYGFFITTNEYPFFSDGYNGAQIYVLSKKALAEGAASPNVIQFENVTLAGNPGFTVWPATAPNGAYATSLGGSEYFLSSMAAEEAGSTNLIDNRLGLWTVSNTQSLDGSSPALVLQNSIVPVQVYGQPPQSAQKAGDVPLAECLNDDCLGFGAPPAPQVEGPLDSNDTRMQQVVYANGLVWGALDTIVNVGGQDQAGIAYFGVRPVVTGSGNVVGNPLVKGYLAVAGNNVTYPALAMLDGGRGVMAFTLVGADYYPSAAYTVVSRSGATGSVRVAGAGVGPQDGFTEYFIGGGRPRWGDYGAAVVDGNSIWIASEYIAQTCTYAQFLATGTSCGGTRTSLANWATHVGMVTP